MRVTMTRETLGDDRLTLKSGETYEVRDELARWLIFVKKAKPAAGNLTQEPAKTRKARYKDPATEPDA